MMYSLRYQTVEMKTARRLYVNERKLPTLSLVTMPEHVVKLLVFALG